MTRSRFLQIAATGAAIGTFCFSDGAFAKPPVNWDGLVQVPAKRADYLYLRPGADFSQYQAIILDPPEVAFRKGWQKDMNRSRMGVSRISDTEVRHAIEEAQAKLPGIFAKRFQSNGFQIVSAPAENAMRIFVGVANVDVAAPEIQSGARSHSFSERAGSATLFIEARDSLSGELLGRAVDHSAAGDYLVMMRNSVSNWADFEHLFDEWATISAKGLRTLTSSPSAAPR